MAESELPLFMAAIRRLESGQFEGNYSALGPVINSGHYKGDRARGAYQIMGRNWPAWSREAGVGGAPITSRKAQDKVAAFKFRQYYQRYQDWRLVAIAWFAGQGTADKAARRGIDSVEAIRDQLGTGSASYAKKIVGYMEQASKQGYGELADLPELPLEPEADRYTRSLPRDSLAVLEGAVLGDPTAEAQSSRSTIDQTMQGILSAVSEQVKRRAVPALQVDTEGEVREVE